MNRCCSANKLCQDQFFFTQAERKPIILGPQMPGERRSSHTATYILHPQLNLWILIQEGHFAMMTSWCKQLSWHFLDKTKWSAVISRSVKPFAEEKDDHTELGHGHPRQHISSLGGQLQVSFPTRKNLLSKTCHCHCESLYPWK